MVLDCILDDHPELDGVLVDSSFRFDERMIGSEAVSFRRDVLIVETQSTSNGRFGIVKLDIIDCQSCGIRCHGRMGLIQHVAGCVGHQQLLQRMGQEWAQRLQRVKRTQQSDRIGTQQQVQVQDVHPVPEDAQEQAKKLAVEQALDLVCQVLDRLQDPGMQEAAESAVEKVQLQVEQGQLQPLQQKRLLKQLRRLPPQPLPQQLEQQLEQLESTLEQQQRLELEREQERKNQQRQLERELDAAQHQPRLQRQQLQWQLAHIKQLRQSGKWQLLHPLDQESTVRHLQDAQVQVHRAHEFHQAQKQAQKAQKRAQGEVRWQSETEPGAGAYDNGATGVEMDARSEATDKLPIPALRS
ncbi:hypothetical protein BKA62DRAFT_255157 [Auriculariales sp. MPI-PUGE-AT-0066]|nr:hypothetical protein BKA62DRAFT_255157 [Auriculariales sp. MPI-PUGE-AT-0066]